MNYLTTSLCAVFLASAFYCHSAENLIFNSGFELGDAGTSLRRVLQPDTNPGLIFEGSRADSYTFVSGGKSLRIPNRFAERCELFFKEFKLKPGVEYTFSFSVKSEIPKRKVSFMIRSWAFNNEYYPKGSVDGTRDDFTVGENWIRKSYTFKTKSPWPNEWFFLSFNIGNEKDSLAGDIWLDDMQLVEGKSSEYSQTDRLEAAVAVERPYLIADGKGEKMKARLLVHNGEGKKADLKLQVNAIEESTGAKAFTKDFNVSLNPGESKDLPFELAINSFGTFRLEPQLLEAGKPFASHPGFIAVIGKYERKPIDIEKNFCVGLNTEATNYVDLLAPHVRVEKTGYVCGAGSYDAFAQMLEDMGCRLVRDWGNTDAFRWRYCEPEAGKFDFSGVDRTIEIYKRHGISVMPVIASIDFNDTPEKPKWPDWLKSKCVKLEKSGINKKTINLPPIDLWKRYLKNLASHCKGKVKFYEIGNELNDCMNPDTYVEYLKAAYQALKEGDPDAKVVGFCATADLSCNLEGFLGSCFNLGGLEYADIVSFHPYDAPSLASRKPADKQVDELKRLMKLYGKNKTLPLWNTELFYLRGDDRNYLESRKHNPYHVAWRFLTDLGEGISQTCFLPDSQIYKETLMPHTPTDYTSNLNRLKDPSADFVVLNALARLFEGAKPVDKINLGNDSICYVYERDGKMLAAFWHYGDMKDLKFKLDVKTSDVKLFDLFGNEIPFPENGTLKLGPETFYIEAKEAKGFVNILKKGVVEAARPVEVGVISRLVPQNGGWALAVSILNCSGRDLSGRLGVQGEGLVGLEGAAFTVPAKGEILVPVQVKIKEVAPEKAVAKFAIDNKIWEIPLIVAPQGKVLRSGEQVQVGPASLKVLSDVKTLKLAFDVKDTTPSGFTVGRDPWDQDCIELFIDADPIRNDMKHPDTYTDNVARLFILPYAPEGKNLVVWPGKLDLKAAKVSVSKKADGYTAELELPLATFAGKSIGFEAQFDDADTVKRQSSANWNSNGDAFKSRLSFGFIETK
jgi:hypothetical protein